MARKSSRPAPELPPADWTPTQAVPEPVVNSPYVEPKKHWVYRKVGGAPFLDETGRRSAGYFFKTKKVSTQQETFLPDEETDDLPLVNRLRHDVKRWRESSYRGATPATKDLLAHWKHADERRRLFFCQLEAAETIIYLLEIAIPGRLASTGFRSFEEGVNAEELSRLLRGERPRFVLEGKDFFPRLVDPPADSSLLPLRRLGCKMATGSGKTIVMAMLIAWAFVNRGRNPAATTFPSAVLVCAPNLTVKKRLEVLKPGAPGNYYDLFDLVPAKYRDLLGGGRVLVTNWHVFHPKKPGNEGGTTYRVVDKGEETAEAFARNRLGELAERLPLLVLNDEGHHCWRPKPGASATVPRETERTLTAEEKKALDEEADEARVWLEGLDQINNAGLIGRGTPCISACVDLSATPFYLANSGYEQGSPFPWLVSDFGLIDAIESGIVKIPRLVVRDDTAKTDEVGRPDPKYFRLWRKIDEDLLPHERFGNRRPKPDAVYEHAQGALETLASQWQKKFNEIRKSGSDAHAIPPVMIVVCDNTEIADIFFQKISGERRETVPAEDGDGEIEKTIYDGSSIGFPDLANEEGRPKRTIRIDTKLLAKIETEEDETKDEAAEALRQIINTVGKPGESGEQIRCVVSVAMLTEGWDATNVTHILGVRAFESQLLCEQVVGRGLRRMSYLPDDKGMLPAEYVDVYGIPFSLIPFKGKPKEDSGVDPVHHHVYAVEERAKLEIRMPVVESYVYELRGAGITCNVDALEGLIVTKEPTEVFVAPTRGYRDAAEAAGTADEVKQDRSEFHEGVREQALFFGLARKIVDDLVEGFAHHKNESLKEARLARHLLFPEILKIVEDYVRRRVTFAEGVDHRELALDIYAKRLIERVRSAIVPVVGKATLRPVLNSYHRTETTAGVNYSTTRPIVPLTKSHLNAAVVRSSWERDAIDILEDMDTVECFAPNDRRHFTIPYENAGARHQYEPDFLVRMRGGTIVLLEIKGEKGEVHDRDLVRAKNVGAEKWKEAVNAAGVHGKWAFVFCENTAGLHAELETHADRATIAATRPFRSVEPGPGDRFKTCVPLTTLRAAAGRFSEEQANLDLMAAWASEWVTFESKTPFEPGMFVARVQGDSMTPEVQDGDYCLFRAPRAGSRQGKRLLVWHSGVSDPHTGGHYTLKVYTSEKAATAEGWQHTKIVLKPLNPAHEPIVLTPEDEGEVRVVAEFLGVVAQRP